MVPFRFDICKQRTVSALRQRVRPEHSLLRSTATYLCCYTLRLGASPARCRHAPGQPPKFVLECQRTAALVALVAGDITIRAGC